MAVGVVERCAVTDDEQFAAPALRGQEVAPDDPSRIVEVQELVDRPLEPEEARQLTLFGAGVDKRW